MEINTLDILKNLAIILVAAKLLGIVARKLGAPQVVGEIIAGLIVGPCMLNFVSYDGFISGMAEIGVILLMFSAGLGTDLKELIKTGPVALLVAFAGVIVSVAGGAAVYQSAGGSECHVHDDACHTGQRDDRSHEADSRAENDRGTDVPDLPLHFRAERYLQPDETGRGLPARDL